jgi:S1-C subfamily serine protease
MSRAAWILAVLFAAACASLEPAPRARPVDGLLPGTIGIVVKRAPAGVVVVEAAKNELRVGDVIMRYNGVPVTDERHLYRLILNSLPGSVAELDVLRDGRPRRIAVPVGEIDTALRG